jgi:hypothetical protein
MHAPIMWPIPLNQEVLDKFLKFLENTWIRHYELIATCMYTPIDSRWASSDIHRHETSPILFFVHLFLPPRLVPSGTWRRPYLPTKKTSRRPRPTGTIPQSHSKQVSNKTNRVSSSEKAQFLSVKLREKYTIDTSSWSSSCAVQAHWASFHKSYSAECIVLYFYAVKQHHQNIFKKISTSWQFLHWNGAKRECESATIYINNIQWTSKRCNSYVRNMTGTRHETAYKSVRLVPTTTCFLRTREIQSKFLSLTLKYVCRSRRFLCSKAAA